MTTRKLVLVGAVTACASVWALSLVAAGALAVKQYIPGPSFGEPCKEKPCGDGQFDEPSGVAVNEVTLGDEGDVYVIDAGDQRVERFGPGGAYLSQWDGVATAAKSFGFSEDLDANGISIDNSHSPVDPAKGDVYVIDPGHNVVDQFNAEGIATGLELKGTCPSPGPCTAEEVIPFPGRPLGVAVDFTGDVWISEGDGMIDVFSDTGEFLESRNVGHGAMPGLAVAPEGAVFALEGAVYPVVANGHVVKLVDKNTPSEFGSAVTALAVNPASDDVLLDTGSSIERFTSSNLGAQPKFDEAVGALAESHGIAVDGVAERQPIYADERGFDRVQTFEDVTLPSVGTPVVGEVSENAMTLYGSIEREGEPVTSCRFEYGETSAHGQSVPCEQALEVINKSGGRVTVSAKLSGLPAAATRHFALVATNANGVKRSEDVSIALPVCEAEEVGEIGPGSATFDAHLQSGGTLTTYQVVYGPTEAYGDATAQVSLGAPEGSVAVRVALGGLHPNTLYHARVLARNGLGETRGDDISFTTATAAEPGGSGLPDGRVYENVSLSADADGEVYPPFQSSLAPLEPGQTTSLSPVRAAANGDAIAYASETQANGGGGGANGVNGGDTFVATRTGEGWATADLTPAVKHPAFIYQGFSNDLSLGFLVLTEGATLVPEAPAYPCAVLYSHDTGQMGVYSALFTGTETPGKCGRPVFAGASADGSSVIFESAARLVPEAEERKGQHQYANEQEGQPNLYDSVDGHVYLVNVLPESQGGRPDVNAAFGGVSEEGEEELSAYGVLPDSGYHHFGGAISDNGSRVVWTDLNTGSLYVRVNPGGPDARTVLVAEDAYYRGASGDATKILFTKGGSLYEYDTDTGVTNNLTPVPGASVLGTLGNSDDASYIYFVAEGVLASNENANHETARGGQGEGLPNLYVWHDGTMSFIATLSPLDDVIEGPALDGAIIAGGYVPYYGDWRAGLNTRMAEVTPGGHEVMFVSHRNLTGYQTHGLLEVYVYDAEDDVLACASCNSTGASPTGGGAFVETPEAFNLASVDLGSSYQLRTISKNGNRVFFDSAEPLVSHAAKGIPEVYEWEREGEGTCTGQEVSSVTGGCVFMLSGGLGSEAPSLGEEGAVFLDADETGDNVFFTTRAQLVGEDRNEFIDVYDARVDGGVPHVELECTGSGCQGSPGGVPIFATPASVTFHGVGNYEQPSSAPPRQVDRKHVRCTRGLVRSHGRCVRRRRARRRAKRSLRTTQRGRR